MQLAKLELEKLELENLKLENLKLENLRRNGSMGNKIILAFTALTLSAMVPLAQSFEANAQAGSLKKPDATTVKPTQKPVAKSVAKPVQGAVKKTIENDKATALKACESFVQDFYDWYIPEMTNNVPAPVNERVLKVKARSFSAELVRMLKRDLEESKKVPDEIVGLDFDPFVNSQETPNHFVTGKATVHPSSGGNKYQVEVYDTTELAKGKDFSSKKKVAPAVTPELMYKNGQWYFTNFLYGKTKIAGNESLLSILKIQQENRNKAGISDLKSK